MHPRYNIVLKKDQEPGALGINIARWKIGVCLQELRTRPRRGLPSLDVSLESAWNPGGVIQSKDLGHVQLVSEGDSP